MVVVVNASPAVQAAVDTEHHLIVAHEVTNVVVDRTLLSPMARLAKDAMAVEKIDVLADRGYFSGEEVLACEAIGATPYVPKPLTSNAKAVGRFGKDDFIYLAEQNAYRCPAGETLSYRYTWMGYTHFLTRGLERVKAEMSLCVLAYNIKRMISILGVQPLIAAVRG